MTEYNIIMLVSFFNSLNKFVGERGAALRTPIFFLSITCITLIFMTVVLVATKNVHVSMYMNDAEKSSFVLKTF